MRDSIAVRLSSTRDQSGALFSVRVFPVDLLTKCSLVQAGQVMASYLSLRGGASDRTFARIHLTIFPKGS